MAFGNATKMLIFAKMIQNGVQQDQKQAKYPNFGILFVYLQYKLLKTWF